MTGVTPVLDRILVEALGRELPADRLVLDPEVLASISRDQAPVARVGRASVALRARSEHEVQAAVRICADLGVPVVPRGAGTGLSGGANAVDGCLVLDLCRLDAVVEVDQDNLVCVVQAGVVNDDLKAAVAEHGLWYPPDPASSAWSTIGGNVATNAGGACCLKYGVTRDYVLGVRAVVGGPVGYGTVAELGRRTSKGVAGYDLTALFVGSEGTLGVVTEATLRLRPARSGTPITVVAAFRSLAEAGRAVAAVTAAGLVPAALELIDRTCLAAVEAWKNLGLEPDAAALLLARVDDPGESAGVSASVLVSCLEASEAMWAMRSTDEVEAEALFEARRLAYCAVERLGPVLSEDVCVPRSRLAEMLLTVEEISARHDVVIATIAHAGDGNLHPLIRLPVDEVGLDRAMRAFEEILRAALDLGGTVTGEHGIGLLKVPGLVQELTAVSAALQWTVKDALDPLGIFNPNKALPTRRRGKPAVSIS